MQPFVIHIRPSSLHRMCKLSFCTVPTSTVPSHKPSSVKGLSEADLDKLRQGMHLFALDAFTFLSDEKWDDEPSVTPSNHSPDDMPAEYGNKPKGPEPTRFGDWQYKGRSTDF